MKILIHGFGSYPVFFKDFISCYKKYGKQNIEWHILLFDDYHLNLFNDLDGVFVHRISKSNFEYSDALIDYSYVEHIDSEKRNFKRSSSEKLENAYKNCYSSLHELFSVFSPDAVLLSQIEGYEGRLLVELAKSRKVEVLVPTSVRLFPQTFFATDEYETLYNLDYVADSAVNIELLREFRSSYHVPPLRERITRWFKRQLVDGWEFSRVRQSLMNNLPLLRDWIWAVNKSRNSKVFNLKNIPTDFVFYALQYTPESSINTPAPYYVDQFRAIDKLRYNVQGNSLVIVKEHPAALAVRSKRFYRFFFRKAGVRLIDVNTKTNELIENASCVSSVTGTVLIEAAIKGVPIIPFGRSLINNFLHLATKGSCGELVTYTFDNVNINELLRQVSYDFVFYSPEQNQDELFSLHNIISMVCAFDLELIKRGIDRSKS